MSRFRIKGCIFLMLILLTGCSMESLDSRLLKAATGGHAYSVKILLALGANANAKDEMGRTALMLAASRRGATNAVYVLIDNGADVDEKDRNGWTALMHAAKDGVVDAVRVLLDGGADVNAKDSSGWTVLLHAVMPIGVWIQERGNYATYSDFRIVELLLERGVDINATDQAGATALILVLGEPVCHGEDEAAYSIARLLVENGIDVNAMDDSGCRALDRAGTSPLGQFLRNAGAIPGENCPAYICT